MPKNYYFVRSGYSGRCYKKLILTRSHTGKELGIPLFLIYTMLTEDTASHSGIR